MNKSLNRIEDLSAIPLPILSDREAEEFMRWSYVNIYSLKDLKDIYLISQLSDDKTVRGITKKVNEILVTKEKWEERKTLEYLNALVKFQLLGTGYISNESFFKNSKINEELSSEDILILKNVFFSYFRFKEISSWFISPTKATHKIFSSFTPSDYLDLSAPLYFLSERSRFTDTFVQDIRNIDRKYVIESDILMRFWDVYLKWGTTLNILDKFNISQTGEKTIFDNKEVSIVYFIQPFIKFDLIEFIQMNFDNRHIWIPELIHKIVRKYRYSVNDIKVFLVSEALSNPKLTFERTSEIFLIKSKVKERKIAYVTYLFPKINDSYVSNIILRK